MINFKKKLFSTLLVFQVLSSCSGTKKELGMNVYNGSLICTPATIVPGISPNITQMQTDQMDQALKNLDIGKQKWENSTSDDSSKTSTRSIIVYNHHLCKRRSHSPIRLGNKVEYECAFNTNSLFHPYNYTCTEHEFLNKTRYIQWEKVYPAALPMTYRKERQCPNAFGRLTPPIDNSIICAGLF